MGSKIGTRGTVASWQFRTPKEKLANNSSHHHIIKFLREPTLFGHLQPGKISGGTFNAYSVASKIS